MMLTLQSPQGILILSVDPDTRRAAVHIREEPREYVHSAYLYAHDLVDLRKALTNADTHDTWIRLRLGVRRVSDYTVVLVFQPENNTRGAFRLTEPQREALVAALVEY